MLAAARFDNLFLQKHVRGAVVPRTIMEDIANTNIPEFTRICTVQYYCTQLQARAPGDMALYAHFDEEITLARTCGTDKSLTASVFVFMYLSPFCTVVSLMPELIARIRVFTEQLHLTSLRAGAHRLWITAGQSAKCYASCLASLRLFCALRAISTYAFPARYTSVDIMGPRVRLQGGEGCRGRSHGRVFGYLLLYTPIDVLPLVQLESRGGSL